MSDYFQPVNHLSVLPQVNPCFIFKIDTLTFEITKNIKSILSYRTPLNILLFFQCDKVYLKHKKLNIPLLFIDKIFESFLCYIIRFLLLHSVDDVLYFCVDQF